MLFITHDFDVVAEIADHVAVMRYGKVVEQGTKDEVLRKAEHPYTQELLAALPRNLKAKRDAELAANPKPEPETHDSILSVKDLRVWFPVRKGILSRVVDHVKAVDDVSFELPKKQILAVVGESGSGKTTLGRAILQLVPPTGGSAKFEGKELTHMSTGELRDMRGEKLTTHAAVMHSAGFTAASYLPPVLIASLIWCFM
ncbi:MAG: ATP-binding cassette domain-containing protein, partial [Planctomycetota bacterium]